MRIRSINCPSCGGRTRLDAGQTQAQCMHCSQAVDIPAALEDDRRRAAQFPTMTPLRLGMKAQHEGREYELTGRQVLRERDEEGSVSTWEEWVLISPDGDLLYLEFDEGKWKISRPFIPQTPVGPDQLARTSAGGVLLLDGGVMVSDAGRYEIAHAEGEFPFLVTPGKSGRYVDATGTGRVFYSVEWTEDSIEYYRGRFLDEHELYVMFGMQERLQILAGREATARSRRRFGGVCVALSAAALIAWLYAMGSGRVAPNGAGTIPLTQAAGEGVRLGPIPLQSTGRVHRLEVRGRMREESNWVQVILEDDTEGELIAAERDMWDESGYEDGEHWHESDLHASRHFVLRKAGNYYVRLYSEPEPGRTPGAATTASYELRERALFPHYLGIYGFGALIVGVIFLIAGSPASVTALRASVRTR